MRQTITSMTRTKFNELREGVVNGSLRAKWADKTPTTKADKVEEKQIRALGLIFELPYENRKLLDTDQWHELFIVNENGILRLQVI